MKIKNIKAREILDSRGNPTVEAKVILENSLEAKASVPSGASLGEFEALELRDNNPKKFSGKGVQAAIGNIERVIVPKLIGQDVERQQEIDKVMLELDRTENKSNLGANAILAVSLACARAGSLAKGLPLFAYLRTIYNLPLTTYNLPIPMFNIINGGKHSDSGLSVQEFMVVPWQGKNFRDRLETGAEVFYTLRDILERRKLTFAVGDEGGFAPKLKTTEKVFNLLVDIADFTDHQIGSEVYFALDIAASVFYDKNKQKYFFEGGWKDALEMSRIYYHWFKDFPMISIEDPFAESNLLPWSEFTGKISSLGPQYMVVGDDLFTTNLKRLREGIEAKRANAILIKPNQIGTLSETIECINFAQDQHYKIVISHRSGETNDSFIADLAVAVNAEFIKAGAPNRGERVAKYNRLLEIEEMLNR